MMSLSLVRRKAWTLIRMPPRRWGLMVEAMTCLAVARLALVVMPFRTVAARLGEVTSPHEAAARTADAVLATAQIDQALEISWTVRRMARVAPFKAVCLQQAVAAKAMLQRRGIPSALHFGVAPAKGPDLPMSAHAWLNTADVKVTGYPVASQYTELACFI